MGGGQCRREAGPSGGMANGVVWFIWGSPSYGGTKEQS
jgi:hypothetical protein